jgi:low temperature requirement protein LtrA
MATTTAMGAEPPEPDVAPESEHRVTPLELFFDLVFVFAITQVTQFMADDPSWAGLARGALVLGSIWWAWVGYAWLTNIIDPEEGTARLVVFVAMAAMLVVALAIPGAFGDDAVLYAVAYGVVRVAHIALYVQGASNERMRQSVLGLGASTAIACTLLLVASGLDGTAQGAVWLVALLIDFGGPRLVGIDGWSVAPSHFAERHGLIVIVALGESIVALGIGADDVALTAGPLLAATLGVVLVASLWWAYFDTSALVGERRLHATVEGRARNAMARDGYSYLHMPMVLGIVLLALGVKKTLAHVDDPLKPEVAFALLGGVALYLLAHVAFRLRHGGTLPRRRVLAAAVLLALVPLAPEVDALVALGACVAVVVALIAFETVRYADARERIRHQGLAEPPR